MFHKHKNNGGPLAEKVEEAKAETANLAQQASDMAQDASEESIDRLHAISAKLEAGGSYLAHHGLAEMSADVAGLIHKYPIQSVGIGMGLGLLAGSLLAPRK